MLFNEKNCSTSDFASGRIQKPKVVCTALHFLDPTRRNIRSIINPLGKKQIEKSPAEKAGCAKKSRRKTLDVRKSPA